MNRQTMVEYGIDYVQHFRAEKLLRRETRDSPILLPSPLSKSEATLFYHGLPSSPVLVARTSTYPWSPPSELDPPVKELSPVGDHPLKDVWEDNLAFRIHEVLEDMKVSWTSTDVVRIGYRDDSQLAPVIIWIGVRPTSLPGHEGLEVAGKCREVLIDYGIQDVHVEIRESEVTRWGTPPFKFLPIQGPQDRFARFRTRLTTSLGLSICARGSDFSAGTGGLFLTANGQDDRILLLTARHVILPVENAAKVGLYRRAKPYQPKLHIILMPAETYREAHYLPFEEVIGNQALVAQELKQRLDEADENAPNISQLRAEYQSAEDEVDRLYQVYEESNQWNLPNDRVLGHLALSPSLHFGVDKAVHDHPAFTSDWALIEVDRSRIDTSNFYGNVIDLCTVSADELSRKLGPGFTYPPDRLFRLSGNVPSSEIRRGTSDGGENLVVLKNGSGSGLTVGRANDVCSYARSTYFKSHELHVTDSHPYTSQTSKEWAILPFDSESGAFAGKGDSGASVVDSAGRIGGIITGGSGATHTFTAPWGHQNSRPVSPDITYATPISFLLDEMQRVGVKDINLNPSLKP